MGGTKEGLEYVRCLIMVMSNLNQEELQVRGQLQQTMAANNVQLAKRVRKKEPCWYGHISVPNTP